MDKINLHYNVEGSGEPIVFIHGLSDSLLFWEPLASSLKNDYQVIRMDLRGHGESELGSDEITIGLYVNDLIGLLDDLNVGNVNLVGFSLGSVVALDFALKFPGRVSSLVLMSGFAKVDEHLLDVFAKFKSTLNAGFEEFYDFILPMVLCPDVIADNREELEFLKGIASRSANTQAYINAVDACMEFDCEDKLSELEMPALVLVGRYDEITPLDLQRDLQQKIKNSDIVIFDNVKHNLLVGENNIKILEILKDFYKKRKEE